MEEQHPIRSVTANISNKRSWAVDKCGPPAWGLGEVITDPHLKTGIVTRKTGASDLDCSCGTTEAGSGMWGMGWFELAQDRDRWRTFINAVMNLRVP